MTLYELTNEYMELLSLAEDPEVDEQVLADTLEGLTGEIEEKADGYAKVISQINADVDALDKEIARLSEKKNAMKNSADRMKKALEMTMVSTGKTKFKTLLFSFNIQKNPASLKIDVDDIAVPAEFKIPQPDKVDKTAIKKALKDGAQFDWCHLEQTESLRIR